ncbi:O-methyltransferase [Pseudoalteromonas galatheae]|uniref:O-methyltransferase n=1 Tax=Pseudoalteromonas galatheae TaxID=579562 RepID=UPI001108B0C1|nr:O-methyltransferase [Pseudoalteromonas galatheae]NKC19132.1 methyltransferase domain-containing protein [Pseudoalteromonas galatheae]
MVNIEYNALLSEVAELGLKNDMNAKSKQDKYLNITKDTGEFLAFLTKASNVTRILELGTSNGYSTLWFAGALPENGEITTIERCVHKYQQALANIDRARLKCRINAFNGEISTILPKLQQGFDLIFFDADRSIYMDILPLAEKLLAPNGIIVCDNATSHAHELTAFMQYFSDSQRYTTALVPVGKGEFVAYRNTHCYE